MHHRCRWYRWCTLTSQIFEKVLNDPNFIFRGLVEDESWKNLKQKISWHWTFKFNIYYIRFFNYESYLTQPPWFAIQFATSLSMTRPAASTKPYSYYKTKIINTIKINDRLYWYKGSKVLMPARFLEYINCLHKWCDTQICIIEVKILNKRHTAAEIYNLKLTAC